MKRQNARYLTVCVVFLLFAVAAAPLARGAEDSGKADKQFSAEEMQQFMQAATPGPEHKMLAHLVGQWDCQTSAYFGPGPPEQSTGTAVITPVLGGRFFREVYSGTMMNMPFEGLGYRGYDNVKKKFVATWADSFSTGIMASYGDYDPKTKTYTLQGESLCPLGKTMKSRDVTKIIDDDNHVVEIYFTEPGKEEHLTIKIVARRKQTPR